MAAPTATEPFTARQSILATFSHCPLSARFELDLAGYENAAMRRGTLAHTVMEEMFRTMRRTGNGEMPQQEAVEIMYEVLAQRDTPSDEVITLPPDEMSALRQFVIRLASDWTWTPKQFMGIEQRLWCDIECPDGVVRRLTGQPDLLIAEPRTTTVVIVDAKSGYGPPKTPTAAAVDDATGEPYEPRRYLTERGHFQLDAYGLLVLRNFPKVRGATLREIHPRASEKREASLMRDELEHVERGIGTTLMLLDRAERESEAEGLSDIYRPVPGRWCAWCVNRPACPLPAHARGAGAVDNEGHAEAMAAGWVKAGADRDGDRDALKAWVAEHGPVTLPDGRVLAWLVSHDPETGDETRVFDAGFPSDVSPHQYVTRSGHRRERLAKALRDVGVGRPGLAAKEVREACHAIYEGESDSAHQGDLRVLVETGVLVKDGRPARYRLAKGEAS